MIGVAAFTLLAVTTISSVLAAVPAPCVASASAALAAAGIASIPIDEAMKLAVRNGLPHWGNAAAMTGECAILAEDVPRARQAQQCRDAEIKGKAQ